ncbi:chloride channel protein, partial [Pseudomonas sp. ICMP 10191]|uniref:chloride channel protein n=1 Tax=Pseudomonas sp. ICMP 10191 TaxID=1198294 RepID=UPI0015A734F4
FVKRLISYSPLRPFAGGLLIAVAVWALGSNHYTDVDKYIGLGIPSIVQSFQMPMAPWDWLGKMLFTVVSLFGMLAGIGFVAVFAGAANTPLATIVMAMELFGPEIAPLAAIACIASYLVSGHTGIYHAQRVGHS